MFNSLTPQLALAGVVPAAAPGTSATKSGLSAMMGSVRGRMVGRGAPPASVPPPPAVPSSTSVAPQDTSVAPQITSLAPQITSVVAPQTSAPASEQAFDDADLLDALSAMTGAITQMQGCLEAVRADVAGLKHKGSESERVFNALHAEMSDYKRDFVFEHLKPMLRPMLFVFDALEEFDREMALYQTAPGAEAPALHADKVRDNIAFVREQFEQALLTCDVELLPVPEGHFDAHAQKAVATVPVAPELDGLVQSVARLGWTIKGHVLRPTEVVVGRAPKGDTQ